jgi:transcriptional regulator with XRE-family HTH domain
MAQRPNKKELTKAINQRFIHAVELLLREDVELKKGHIAEKLDINPNSLTEILGGRQDVQVATLQNICEIFGVNITYLFFDQLPIIGKKGTENPLQTDLETGTLPTVITQNPASSGVIPSQLSSHNPSHKGKKGENARILYSEEAAQNIAAELEHDYNVIFDTEITSVDEFMREIKLRMLLHEQILRDLQRRMPGGRSSGKRIDPKDLI